VDSDSLSGSHTPQILAMPCGEAGHVLGLVRPCVERYGWGKHSSVRLSVLGTDSSDQGHWIGTGGAIRQIIFEDGENGPGTWLAVRQATVITIFRPIYGKSLGSSIRPSGSSRTYLPSNLDPNPLVELRAERSSSSSHVDFSFNPWYARQFAVVDPLGRWSIWDIEGRHGKNSSFELVPGKSASFYDGSVPDPTGKILGQDFADGWHRILWTCNISTIVLCNRHHLAVFDMKTKPIRLQIPDFLEATNTEWILDIKRSALNFNHIFVLTTSRIIWIEVSPGGEQRDGHIGYAGAKIILSYRHFRDASDESLRLTTLKDDNGMVFKTLTWIFAYRT
jgi:RNA polymerase I-specific transcription initiation factor RRN6